MKKKLIIIDGNALLHRAFHALPDTLRTRDGVLTNAVYGFMLVFLKVLDEFSPAYAVAAFDRKGKTFRHKAYGKYKAQREKAPDELYAQIPLVKKVLKAFGVPIFAMKGVEADDVAGAIAKKASRHQNLEAIIVTGDLDTLQLVDDKVKVFTLRRGTKDTVLYDEKEVEKKMGVKPDQVVDYKALAGDASDNIPGVAGVGAKTAAKLLVEFKDLDGVYANLEKIGGSVAEKLKKAREDAYLSQRLAQIQADMNVDFSLGKAKFGGYDKQQVRQVLEELEFNTLVKRLNLDAATAEQPESGAVAASRKEEKRGKLWEMKLEDLAEEAGRKKLVQKIKKEKELLIALWERPEEKIRDKTVFECQLECVALMGSAGQEVIILASDGRQPTRAALMALGKLWAQKQLVFFSGKHELELARLWQLGDLKIAEDLKVLGYLVNGGQSRIDYSSLLVAAGIRMNYWEKMVEAAKGQTKLILGVAEDEEKEKLVKQYLAERLGAMKLLQVDFCREKDAIASMQDREGVFPRPSVAPGMKNLDFVYREIELPLVRVLAAMELTGIEIDENKLKELKKEYTAKAKKIKAKVFKLAGEEFNLDSSQQLSRVFYEKLKFSTKGIKKGKSGFYSTSAEALEALAAKYEPARLIGAYRELTKLVNTYIDPLPKLVNQQTGRLHAQFNQEITTTGRLSSSQPNLQNIPIRTPEGTRIREALVAAKGFELVSADYSQMELRIAAFYSGDRTMRKVFQEGGDIHTETAARINGLKQNEVDRETRGMAKALNFGLIYGMGTYGFARSAGVSNQEAREFIEKYKEKFPRMFEYVNEAKEMAREKGYVETLFGRRRYVSEIESGNWQQRAAGERMAVNMPLQGTAADIMKLAMVEVFNYLEKNKLLEEVRMLVSVHDEILFEVKKERVRTIARELKKIMEGAVKLTVPLEVELKRGKSWGELKLI